MKTFHYETGHVAGSTMTVGELRAALAQHPDDMPVVVGYEGIRAFLDAERMSVARISSGLESDACKALVIDANTYDGTTNETDA